MKTCFKCKIKKDYKDFYVKRSRGGNKYYQSWCKKCSSYQASESNKKNRKNNPDFYRTKDKERYHKNRDSIRVRTRLRSVKLKKKCVEYMGNKCKICGFSKYLAALDFHHVVKENKEFMITQTTNWNKIEKELQKCVMICSNCHRAIHSGELVINNMVQLDAV